MTEEPMNDATAAVVAARSLDGIRAKAHKPATVAALEACRKRPTRAVWLAAEKACWADVSLDTWDCLWLRQRALEAAA